MKGRLHGGVLAASLTVVALVPWELGSVAPRTPEPRLDHRQGKSSVVVRAAQLRRLPVYEVRRQGATAAEANRLARALGLPGDVRQPDGSIHFLDKDLFERLPVKTLGAEAPSPDEDGGTVVTEAFDFEAIRALRALPDRDARARARAAFKRAGLTPAGTPKTTHSEFSAFALDGTQIAQVAVDTQVSWRPRLNGRPLVGPGAKAEVTFDGQGRVTHLLYAFRRLRKGAAVPLLLPERADKIARARFSSACAGQPPLPRLRLQRTVVYWAPALNRGRVRRIVPHYQYDATALIGGQTTALETIYLPAIEKGVPKVSLKAMAQGTVVSARSTVRGGTPPYTYRYESCAASLTRQQMRAGAATSYEVRPRGHAVTSDTVSVLVTDANGLTSLARTRVQVTAPARRPRGRRLATQNVKDTGSDWIGDSQGLSNTEDNVADFLDEMSDISSIPFSWGDENAFNTDIVDPSFAGDDSNWGDNVDLLWWQGHGNPDGVKGGDSVFVNFSSVKLGNGDLEWIVIHSCKVLRLKDGSGVGLDPRWVQRFAGLHIMFSFASNASNVDGDGNEFGDNIADDDMRMRSAYVDAVVSNQPSGRKFRYLGVIGPGNATNYNDYFHGIGPVTTDIKTLAGYWYYDGYT